MFSLQFWSITRCRTHHLYQSRQGIHKFGTKHIWHLSFNQWVSHGIFWTIREFHLWDSHLIGLVWKAGVLWGSILGPLLFLTYINDFSDGITSTVKVFAGNRLIFSTIINTNILASNLNNNIKKVAAWPFKWKKEALAKVLSCKFCKIFKNAYFEEHLKTTTSVLEKYS